MKIVISALMGPGTLEAKLEPLAAIDEITAISFVRKKAGPGIPGVRYVVLPPLARFPLLHGFLAIFYLIRETIRLRPALLIGYHMLPHALFIAFTGWITRTPYVVAQTGLTIQRLAQNRFYYLLLWPVFRFARHVNCPGHESVKFWQNHYPSFHDKFVVLHSTVDTRRFQPDPQTGKEFDFVFLGRLAPIKNIDLIIRAFHLLIQETGNFQLRLAIVGDGPEHAGLEKLAGDLKLNSSVCFTGFVQEPVSWLHRSRFLVMASTTEGLPTAMMQAMACKVLPVTNLTGNIPDLVEEGKTGFVIPALRAEDIAETMARALKVPAANLQTMQAVARQRIIDRHSHEYAISRWKEVLGNL